MFSVEESQPILSFCIFVYNQAEDLKKCISQIIEYKSEDIEVVISDNASTDNIKKVISDFNDKRIKYFRNDTNIGFNRNVFNALIHARSPFVFLLRTKDTIVPSAIPIILQRISDNPNLSYLTGATIKDKNANYIIYDKEHYSKGLEAINAHFNELYIHPSGCMYALHLINLDDLNLCMNSTNATDSDTAIHTMLRLKMATLGDFEIIRTPIWRYQDSLKTTPATNICKIAPQGSPHIFHNLFKQEFVWICTQIPTEYRLNALIKTYYRYLSSCTYGFALRNRDKAYRKHYCFEKIQFSILGEFKAFNHHNLKLAEDNLDELMRNNYLKECRFQSKRCMLITPIDVIIHKGYNLIYTHLPKVMQSTLSCVIKKIRKKL